MVYWTVYIKFVLGTISVLFIQMCSVIIHWLNKKYYSFLFLLIFVRHKKKNMKIKTNQKENLPAIVNRSI